MRLIINKLEHIDAYFIFENEKILSKEELTVFLDKVKFIATRYLIQILTEKQITSRLVIDLDDELSIQNTLKALPNKASRVDPMYIELNKIGLRFVNMEIEAPLSLFSLRTTITRYLTLQGFEICFKDCFTSGIYIDTNIPVSIINSTMHNVSCSKSTYSISLSDNSLVEVLTDLPHVCLDKKLELDNILLIYIPSVVDEQDPDVIRSIAYRIASISESLLINKYTEIFIITGKVNGFLQQNSFIKVSDDTCDLQLYYKPLGIVTRIKEKGDYAPASIDAININPLATGYIYKLPTVRLPLDLPKIKTNYNNSIDISYLVQKIIKDRDQPILSK